MTNRIKQLDGSPVGSGSGNPVEAVRPANASGSATGGPTTSTTPADSVYITQNARTLTALSQAVQDTPDVDSGRVATLQQSISAGLYNVDPDRIASLMLQLEQDLGGTQSQ